MTFNWLAILVASLIPLLIGFFWYNPKLFGNAWMKESGVNEDILKSGNMAVIFGLSFVFSFLIAISLNPIVIHQMPVYQLIGGDPSKALPSFQAFIKDYGDAYRSVQYGLLHGGLFGIFMIFPVIAITALFERKSWKYILINTGYWIVTLSIMGGIICGWK